MASDNSRTLTNPPTRREIRPDFPQTIHLLDAQKIFEVLEDELGKYGTSLNEVGHITVAYPHKHPELFPNHNDKAAQPLWFFERIVRRDPVLSSIDWLTADGLVETIHLSRTKEENQTSLYALTVHQRYDLHMPSQTTPLPFLEQKREGKEFFVIVDDGVEQGTTVANLMSYIEHNEGTVLAVAIAGFRGGTAENDIAQKRQKLPQVDISPRFNSTARNTGRMEELANTLSSQAAQERLDIKPDKCIALLEKGLNKNGISVYAMTDGECRRLIKELVEGSISFSSLMSKLGVELPSVSKPATSAAPTPQA